MREAAVPGYRLSKSRPSMKVLITLGMIGLLIGLLASAGMTVSRTGLTATDVRAYYLGEPLETTTQTLDAELAEITAPAVARPFDEMVEVTHLHLMGGSMMLFMLCHLISLCRMRDSTRTFLYLVSFGSFIITFTLPWLIVYAAPVFAYLFGPAIVTFLLSLVTLCVIPLKEMWFTSTLAVVSEDFSAAERANNKKVVNGP